MNPNKIKLFEALDKHILEADLKRDSCITLQDWHYYEGVVDAYRTAKNIIKNITFDTKR